MSFVRIIATALVSVAAGLAAFVAAAFVMIDGAPVTLRSALPVSAVTAPMIGVVMFWITARALRAPLEPIRSFVIGGIIVYGTFYGLGLVLTFTGLNPLVVPVLGVPVILFAGIIAVWRSGHDRWT